jgi:hypothetical protein
MLWDFKHIQTLFIGLTSLNMGSLKKAIGTAQFLARSRLKPPKRRVTELVPRRTQDIASADNL